MSAPTVPDGVVPSAGIGSPTIPMAALGEISKQLGVYQIERLLGRGGMGAVYLARQLTLDRFVVIKVIAPELAKERTVVERLHREARAAGKITSDHVVPMIDTNI